MCGGRGTRLDSGDGGGVSRDEKPLVEVSGVSMVDRVLAALCASRVGRVSFVTSPHVPVTRTHLETLLDTDGFSPDVALDAPLVGRAENLDRTDDSGRSTALAIVDAPGEGYVSDLQYALDRVSPPVLTVACDLPLLAPDVIDRVLERAEETRGSLAVYVPAALKRRLGVSTDSTWKHEERELAPTGLNVVAPEHGGAPTVEPTDRDELHPRNDIDGARSTTVATPPIETGDSEDTIYVSDDARLAVNVNRPADLAVAEALCE